MSKSQQGWHQWAAKFEQSAKAIRRPNRKRRHQKGPRFLPIQLEPLEQRQLLTGITQDLFAASAGTVFNSTNFPSWTVVRPTTLTPMITDDELVVTTGTPPNSYYLANPTAGTTSSAQQVSVMSHGEYSEFGLVARADSAASAYYGVQIGKIGGGAKEGYNKVGWVQLVKYSANNTTTVLASTTLSYILNLGTTYNIKFDVETDGTNSSTTDLKADIWPQGTADPGWQVSTTDATASLNQGGANATGYDGIWSNPDTGPSSGNTSDISNYIEGNAGDLPPITNFTASPYAYSGSTYPVTVTFNAAATSASTITSYGLDFGDGSPTTTASSVVNFTHTYTAAPPYAYTATLTVTDNSSPSPSTSQEQIVVAANPSVASNPTANLTVNRAGGNGTDPLLVNFQSNATAYTGQTITSYALDFGDGSIMNAVVPSGVSTFSIDTVHSYTGAGLYDATLTVTDSDGATKVLSQTVSENPTPPTVVLNFNSSTSLLTAVFSEDVGAALVSEVDANDNPLGEPLWTDGAASAGAFATTLDIRNDNSGGSVLNSTQLISAYSYNASNNTATWNLVSAGLNTTSTSYTARLFSDEIQDQAGNDLDGIGSGIGGEDATYQFGFTSLNTDVTLATSGVWNSAMPLVFAPTLNDIPGDGSSISTTAVGGVASTMFVFPNTSTYTSVVSGLKAGTTEVILQDLLSPLSNLNGTWLVNKVVNDYTFDLKVSSSSLNDSHWSSLTQGSLYLPNNSELSFIADLEAMTGATSIPTTGLSTANGVFLGYTSEYDTNTAYDKQFDGEAQLGSVGYIVRSDASNDLFILGGSIDAEHDAFDAFLQSNGFEQYGPADNGMISSSQNAPNVWQIMPSLPTLSGSWDIRQVPSIAYQENVGDTQTAMRDGWVTYMNTNYGGGEPAPATQQLNYNISNYSFKGKPASLLTHPDWWSEQSTDTNIVASGSSSVVTFTPPNPVVFNDTYSISLTNGTTTETVSVTASDTSPQDLVNAFYSAIVALANNSSTPFFESSSITVANTTYTGADTTDSWNNPILEMYGTLGETASYTAGFNQNSVPIVNAVNCYAQTKLNFLSPGVINYVLNTYVAPWVSDATRQSGDMLTLSPSDGGGYDQSPALGAAMTSLWDVPDPYQGGGAWYGATAGGIFVSGDSEAYWAFVNDMAQYVLQHEPAGMTLYVGALAYESVTMPPSFPLEPNIYVQASEIFAPSGLTTDQIFKEYANLGAQVGPYKASDEIPTEEFPGNVENSWTIYNEDHVLAVGGEYTIDFGYTPLGYYLSDMLSNDASLANPTAMQNLLNSFYNQSFGLNNTSMEDYFVMFNGTAADPGLADPPAQVAWSSDANSAGVTNDLSILKESFGYLDAANTFLNAANSNGSITTAQYNADVARVQQFQMYNIYLFDRYKLLSDSFTNGYNEDSPPTLGSAAFTTIMNDLTNYVSWVDKLAYTGLIDVQTFLTDFWTSSILGNYQPIWSNDPNGSNGLKVEYHGLRAQMNTSQSIDYTPSISQVNSAWLIDDAAVQGPPLAPSDLTITNVTTSEIDLSWTDPSGIVSGIYVDRSSTSSGGFTPIATLSATATAYSNTGLTNNTTYYYEVFAYNSYSSSAPSNIAVATTGLSGMGAPILPQPQPDGTNPTSAIDLSWVDNDDGTATGFNVERSTVSGSGFSLVTTLGASATTYTDTGLLDGTTYYYEVQAFNATTTSLFSNVANATTALAAPMGFSALTVSPTEIDLSWIETSAAATTITIQRSTDDATWTTLGTVSAAASAYQNTGLAQGQTYYYQIWASDSGETSDTVSANAVTSLAAPSGLTAAAASSSQINLSWTDNDGGAANGYGIDQSTNDSSFTLIATVSSGATAYTNTGLADGTNYYFEIQAFNSINGSDSDYSSPANAVTPMIAPSSLTATEISSSQINLSWTDNDGGSATSYDIDRSTTSTGGFTQIATVGPGATAYTNTGLTSNTAYFYEVDAVNSNTTSAFSNVAGAYTLGIPSTLTATTVSYTQINLAWVDNDGGAASGYNIDRSTNDASFSLLTAVAAGVAAYTDTSVSAGGNYYYEVQAFTATSTSAFSSIANANSPAHEVGGIVNDDFYGTNGSSWSSQWTFVNDITEGVPSATISNNQGLVTLTKTAGDAMGGTYYADDTAATMIDSYETATVSTITQAKIDIMARDNSANNTYYYANLDFGPSKLYIDKEVAGVATALKTITFTFASNGTYDAVFEVVTANSTTTDLDVKVWSTASTEPTTWTGTVADTTASLQGVSGYTGLRFNPTGTGTTPINFTVDNFEAADLTTGNVSYTDNFQNLSTTGWSPLTASRWSVGADGDSKRYYINTTSYAGGSGGSLGEYSLLTATGETNIGDFTMTVDVKAASSAAGSNYAIIFGYQTAGPLMGSYYFMEFNATSGDTQLYKVVSGTATSIVTASGAWITDTNYHSIKIQRSFSTISVWFDGQSVLSATDSTLFGGEMGIGAMNDSAYFDNVIIG